MMKSTTTLFVLLFTLTLSAQKDHNFMFLAEGYSKISISYKIDSTVQKQVDSTGNFMQVVVTKSKDEICISQIDPSKGDVYKSKVEFFGVTQDGKNTLIYHSTNKETILINPLYGFTVVCFKDQNPVSEKYRGRVNHCFGGETRLLRD